MSSTTHKYNVSVQWSGGREGSGKLKAESSGTSVSLAVPPEFQGPGGGSNPEELLTSAIAGCFAITYGIVAANRKVPVSGLNVEAEGQVSQNGAALKYDEIVIRPRITLTSDASDEQVLLATELAHKAESYCLITNAVRGNVVVKVEPTVIRS